MFKRYALIISRVLVGALFIISGLIKANDALGFSYKLEEYVAPDVLNWVLFQGVELELAALVCIAEILLGVAVLAGEKFRLASWSLLLMIVFFSFLTGYTAIGNWFFENHEEAITLQAESLLGFEAREIHYFKDCGCFGDAIQLTPMQSFLKDIVLLVFIIILFVFQKEVKGNSQKDDFLYYGASLGLISLFSIGILNWFFPILFSILTFGLMIAIRAIVKSNAKGWVMAAAATLVSGIFTWYTYAHLPLRDFRPYAVGKNITEGMTMPEGEEPPQYMVMYTMQSQSTGQTQEVSSIDYLEKEVWKNKDLKIINTGDQILYKDGYVPPIHDFVLEDLTEGIDRTEEVLALEQVALWVAYDISTTDSDVQNQVSELSNSLQSSGVAVFGLTGGMYDQVEEFRHQNNLAFPFLSCDATTLKTVIRSNPGLVLLKKGTVIGKWHHNDIPTFEQLSAQW